MHINIIPGKKSNDAGNLRLNLAVWAKCHFDFGNFMTFLPHCGSLGPLMSATICQDTVFFLGMIYVYHTWKKIQKRRQPKITIAV